MEAPTATEITAAVSDEAVIVQPITVERKPDVFIQEVQKTEKKDSKKIKKKSKKRSKSKKTKKTEKDTAAKEAASSQIPETDITSPKLALASEVTAVDVDQPNIVPRIPEETAEKPVITVEPKGEKKDSKKIKKKSKKRTKSKKTKKTEKDIAAKEAASSQIPETDITSPKLTLASEVTAINVDQLDIVPPIAEETDEKPVITDIPKENQETEKDITAKEAASSQVTETHNKSPKFTQASEVTAVDIDQPNIVPPIAEETAEKPVITVEPKGEKKDSKKIKKKSKKRTKSKKTKKTEKDIAAKEAASSQIPETDITSLKLALATEETDKKPVITVEPKGEKKDSKKIKKKSKKRTKSKKTKETEKDIAAKEAASSQIPETDITSLKLTLASEVTATNVDQLDIVPSIPEETDKKPEITMNERYSAKEAASSQIPETDITSPNLALASEVTAINVDQLDIAPSIPEETDEKPVITDIPKGEKKDSEKIKKKSKKRTKSKKTKKTEKDRAAKEGATSQVTETDITSPKFTLASEDTAVDVDQQNIVPTIPEETVEKPLLKDEPKGEKKDSKKIKKKSKKRTKSKKTKKTEKDIAAKEAASSQETETDITSRKLALASEVTAINVDQLDIIKKKSKKRTKSKKTKKTEKDIAAKEAASSQDRNGYYITELALASEVTAINVDQLDIVPSIAKETDEKPVITVNRKNGYYITNLALASEVTAINVDQLDMFHQYLKKQTKNQ
ncbi:Zonadhesin [Trichinella spiralis]|uniref:Zonadhesin n=1 Tax=Trichinella spiralis TaxID=6334 RepID=A0ABR3KN06_TRISP